MVSENDFWITFLPNVVATLVGVILGVPIAMWLNRLSLSATNRRDEFEGRKRLRHGLEALIAALVHNQAALQAIAAQVVEGRIPFDSAIDAVAWDASRSEIVPFLRDPDLHRKAALYFSRVESLRRLTGMYLDVMLGRTVLTPIAQDDLRQHLLHELRVLREEANQVLPDLRARLSELERRANDA